MRRVVGWGGVGGIACLTSPSSSAARRCAALSSLSRSASATRCVPLPAVIEARAGTQKELERNLIAVATI